MDEDLERVVDGIYEAAVAEDQWGDALVRIASLVAGASAMLHEFNPVTGGEHVIASFGFKHASIVDYEAHYYALDLWRIEVKRSTAMTTATILTDLVPAKAWENSEIWNDYVKRDLGVFYCLGAKIPLPRDGLVGIGIQRYRDVGDFTTKDASVLQALLPHLRRAFLVRVSLTEANGARLRALEALDALAVGVIFVDASCRVVHANFAAEAILAQNDGLRRDATGRLTATVYAETKRLHRLVAEAAPRAVGRPSSAGGAIGITRVGPLGPLALMVSPLPAERLPLVATRPMVMLVVSDPHARGVAPAETLVVLYGLTAAEARLAAALATGATLEGVATRLGIALNTARWHLKHVFEKMGVHHQTELAALVAALPMVKQPPSR